MLKLMLLVTIGITGVVTFPERRAHGCMTPCPTYIITFCGSDGKTYSSNTCFERNRLCREGNNDWASFHSLHYGACTGNETKQDTTAAKPELHKKDRNCNTVCPQYIITFCGSDGKTYTSNYCFERSRLCREGSDDYASFNEAYYGPCKTDTTKLP